MSITARSLRTLLAFAWMSVALPGCAGPPPTVAVSNAEVAIRKADAIGATQYAPLELHVARQKLESAGRALEEGEYLDARRLAEQARVDGELAEAKTRAGRARENSDQVAKTVEALRGESKRGGPITEPLPAARSRR